MADVESMARNIKSSYTCKSLIIVLVLEINNNILIFVLNTQCNHQQLFTLSWNVGKPQTPYKIRDQTVVQINAVIQFATKMLLFHSEAESHAATHNV